jgi:hypothetical protein
MCNAHNHFSECRCGWGGEGNKGGGNHASYSGCRESDFCRPTRCPECGRGVFFIRHNGGCVWVDSLGWPWPKHPCFEDYSRDFYSSLQNGAQRFVDSIIVVVIKTQSYYTHNFTELVVVTAHRKRARISIPALMEPHKLIGKVLIVSEKCKLLTVVQPSEMMSLQFTMRSPNQLKQKSGKHKQGEQSLGPKSILIQNMAMLSIKWGRR